MQRLAELSDLGVSLAIDDFGAGYSNLACLKELPIRKLKIDQSLVDGLTRDDNAHAIVSTIIHLGQALNMTVVAKGVETQAQLQIVQSMGCDYFQGHLFAPALTPDALGILLQESAARRQLETKPFQSM